MIEHWRCQTLLKGCVRVVEPGVSTKISSQGAEEQRGNVIDYPSDELKPDTPVRVEQ